MVDFKPAQKIQIQDYVIEEIKRQLIGGTYKPGDRLPSETELAAKLNVSRATVREAMKALVKMNVVNVIQGKGTFVTKQPGLMDNPLEFYSLIQTSNIQSLFETRLLIEPQAAALAAERATPEDLELIRMEAERINESVNGDMFVNGFHEALAHATHNPILEWLIAGIEKLVNANAQLIEEVSGVLEQSIYYHMEIYKAVRDHDQEQAKNCMIKHLETILAGVDKNKSLILKKKEVEK
jgi:GntR family transcriptional repressor for pyruvate dehydrogenase complex